MNTLMYFELNRHPAQVPRTKIEFWGGLISDLEGELSDVTQIMRPRNNSWYFPLLPPTFLARTKVYKYQIPD